MKTPKFVYALLAGFLFAACSPGCISLRTADVKDDAEFVIARTTSYVAALPDGPEKVMAQQDIAALQGLLQGDTVNAGEAYPLAVKVCALHGIGEDKDEGIVASEHAFVDEDAALTPLDKRAFKRSCTILVRSFKHASEASYLPSFK